MSGIYEELKNQLDAEKGAALATVVRGTEGIPIGRKLLVYPDKTAHGTLGNAQLDAQVTDDAAQIIWGGDARIHTYTLSEPGSSQTQSFDIFIEGFTPPPELLIIGAGHIAIPLATIAKTLNYHVTVIDARAAFATPERFPNVDELIVAWPDEVLEQRPLYPSTAVAVLTHDPKFDEPTLTTVLKRHQGYVGAIGSRKTNVERAERLRQQGLSEEQVRRIHGPIGLDIGASTPEEIALSIMAQIVAVRHQKE